MTEHPEPLVLINLISMPAERVDSYVAGWEANIAAARAAAGFRGTWLHRAIDADARYPLVNIARWDSKADWEAAVSRYFSVPLTADPARVAPALYRIVHVTPDPRDDVADGSADGTSR